jgi:DDE superfamily endonuclease
VNSLEQFRGCFSTRLRHASLRRYLQGLGDSPHKSMQAMLARVTDPEHYQAFQHFITHATWDWQPVWRRLPELLPVRDGILVIDLVEEPLIAVLDRSILSDDHHAVGFRTRDWLIRKLRDRLGFQPQVLELARHDGRRFHVHGPLAWLGLDLVRRPPDQRGPRARRQCIGLADEIRPRVIPKHEPDAGGVPPVQVLRLAEIGIAAEGDPAKSRGLAPHTRLVEPRGGPSDAGRLPLRFTRYNGSCVLANDTIKA